MKTKLMVALDFPTAIEAQRLVEYLGDIPVIYKVGLELFASAGPDWVRTLAKSYSVFLDLKLYDIPNTVGKTVENIARLGVQYTTLHMSGGAEMLKAAIQIANKFKSLQLLGVTVLTSFSDETWQKGMAPVAESRIRTCSDAAFDFYKSGINIGLNGFVCAPLELTLFRTISKSTFLVTPGIRFEGESSGDQSRVASPGFAAKSGASAIVMGRSIIGAKDPLEASRRAIKELGA